MALHVNLQKIPSYFSSNWHNKINIALEHDLCIWPNYLFESKMQCLVDVLYRKYRFSLPQIKDEK